MRRSWLWLFLALGCAGSPARQGAPPPRILTIVGINDTHGALLPTPPPKWAAAGTGSAIGGADWFAGYLDAIRADSREKGGGVLVLDAGDAFQGTMISNQFGGRSVTDVYNAVGVTAAALTSQLPLSGERDEYGAHFAAFRDAPAPEHDERG